MKSLRILRYICISVALVLIAGCKAFEYAPDRVTVSENGIQVENVGFKGFTLSPPEGYELVAVESIPANNPNRGWAQSLHHGYRNSEGSDYHFHQEFVFKNGTQLIYFIPFQCKAVGRFRHVPDDIKERFLIDWARNAEFAKIIDYDLSWDAESDSRGHSTVILKSKQPKNGWVYEERVMTGDLNEMFLFAAFTQENQAEDLSQQMRNFTQALQVLR